MTDRHPSQSQGRRSIRPTSATGGGTPTGVGAGGGVGERPTLLGRIQDHAPNSTQLVGLLTLLISGGILLILTGITITATIMGLIFFTPLIILSSPIWIPVGTVLFLAISGFLTISGFGVSVLGGSSWMYKYLRGRHPPGSDRINYARSRIADTASHVKDYVQSKVKDAAPSA